MHTSMCGSALTVVSALWCAVLYCRLYRPCKWRVKRRRRTEMQCTNFCPTSTLSTHTSPVRSHPTHACTSPPRMKKRTMRRKKKTMTPYLQVCGYLCQIHTCFKLCLYMMVSSVHLSERLCRSKHVNTSVKRKPTTLWASHLQSFAASHIFSIFDIQNIVKMDKGKITHLKMFIIWYTCLQVGLKYTCRFRIYFKIKSLL